ncbi:MAG TPA: Gfo/Idh/MocA family oxidoreductase, partial [Methylomirabilota bacterium]|nr:Gfo/Idh/MocA family oxidoreductase [Methylomirabilota bacterium]
MSAGALPRVALIGCGLVGQKRQQLLAPGQVTVVCDVKLDRARALAARCPGSRATDSVAQTVAAVDVDVVMIATVNAALAPIALEAV